MAEHNTLPAELSFTDEAASRFPALNPMPAALRQAFEYLEGQGCVHRYTFSNQRFLALHPNPDHLNHTTFQLPDLTGFKCWTGNPDPLLAQRLVPILRTGADGSHAALWLDDNGQQKIVHMGSGSGSMMACVLAHSVEDLLRLLAIGYCELCWGWEYGSTPAELAAEAEDANYPPPPAVLRQYVEGTLGLSCARACFGHRAHHLGIRGRYRRPFRDVAAAGDSLQVIDT